MQENKYLMTLPIKIGDIEVLIQCDNYVLKCSHIEQLKNITYKKNKDVVFNIYFDQAAPVPKHEEKIVWHEDLEPKLKTSWSLSHSDNLLFLKFDSPYPFYYSVLIDVKKRVFDFYFEQKEYFIKNGLDISIFDLEYLLALYTLPKFDGILLYANFVDYHGKGLVFLSKSNEDKKTLNELYRSQPTVRVFENERVIIRKENGRFLIYNVTWQRENSDAMCKPVELSKIFFPKANLINYISRKKRIDACALILDQSFHFFWDKSIMEKTLNFIDKMTCEIPCYNLWFVPDITVIKYLDVIEIK